MAGTTLNDKLASHIMDSVVILDIVGGNEYSM